MGIDSIKSQRYDGTQTGSYNYNYIIFNLGYCDDKMAYSIKEMYNNYR